MRNAYAHLHMRAMNIVQVPADRCTVTCTFVVWHVQRLLHWSVRGCYTDADDIRTARPVKVLTDDSQAESFSHPRLSGYHEDKPTSSLALIPVRRQAVQHFALELLHLNHLPRANCNVFISISSMHNASTFEKHGPHVWIMKNCTSATRRIVEIEGIEGTRK